MADDTIRFKYNGKWDGEFASLAALRGDNDTAASPPRASAVTVLTIAAALWTAVTVAVAGCFIVQRRAAGAPASDPSTTLTQPAYNSMPPMMMKEIDV